MPPTTHADFGPTTTAHQVAAAFPGSIRGKTILVTGVNKLGIGYATVHALASQSPRLLILAGRTEAKLQASLDGLRQDYPNVKARTLLLNLSSQTSAREAAAEVLSWNDVPTIDVMLNNAGIMSIPERTLSDDGIELQFATNHVGHFLFTNLIMPKILAAAKVNTAGTVRVINVSSMAATVSPIRNSDVNWAKSTRQLPETEKPNLAIMKMTGLDVDEDVSYIPMGAYGQSKTANVLYSVALNQRLLKKHGVFSISLHPGEMLSELQRTIDREWFEKTFEWKKKIGLTYKTLEQGASTSLVAALDPELAQSSDSEMGQFLVDCQVSTKLPPYALGPTEADRLWTLTEGLVKQEFSW